jgi:GT2 family glycosyltransferase
MVSVLITTYNSARVLAACLSSLAQQDYRPLEVIIIDNSSTDTTRQLLARLREPYRVFYNESNLGFAAAQNQAMRQARGEWLLTLNPDVVLSPNFISELVAASEAGPRIAVVCGKLLRWRPGENPERTNVLDSTGIYFLRNLRHLDRGAEEPDRGQYDQPEYVFGASGAAVLYRRSAVEDISVDGQFFDEDFFAYREDADVSWRAQLMGWRCLYTPRAVAWHVRRVTPSRFKELPLVINWHSVKNRFLVRAKNISLPLYVRLFLPATWRDAMILGYCVLVNRKLLSAFYFLWRRRQAILEKRRWIQSHRRVSDRALARWFSNRPVSFPLEPAQEKQGVDSLRAARVE